MTPTWVTLTLVAPWAVLLLNVVRASPTVVRLGFALPPALALLLALSGQAGEVAVSGLLLDSLFGVNDVNRVFVGLTGAVWLAAAMTLGPLAAARRFTVFFGLTLAGNLTAVLSQDAASFYAAFAVMSLSAYGLIAHDGTADARFAGRVYLVLAIVAELLLFASLIALSADTTSLVLPLRYSGEPTDWAVAAVIAGFGIKAGLAPLHVTLPLAYAAAPAAAGIALAGAMLNAGILGWILWLPLGQVALPEFGDMLTVLGIAGVAIGVLAGLCQRNARAVLGYSSISQVGLVVIVLGVVFKTPPAWATAAPLVSLFVLHHALAKSAAVTISHAGGGPRLWLLCAAILPAAALTGIPPMLGFDAKTGLKEALATFGTGAEARTLTVASLGTALLMARWWLLIAAPGRSDAASYPGALPATVALLLGYVAVTWVTGQSTDADVIAALWPPVAAIVLLIGIARLRPGVLMRASDAVPRGDIAVPTTALLAAMRARAVGLAGPISSFHAGVRRLRTAIIESARKAAGAVSDDANGDALPAYLAVALTMLLLLLIDST